MLRRDFHMRGRECDNSFRFIFSILEGSSRFYRSHDKKPVPQFVEFLSNLQTLKSQSLLLKIPTMHYNSAFEWRENPEDKNNRQ